MSHVNRGFSGVGSERKKKPTQSTACVESRTETYCRRAEWRRRGERCQRGQMRSTRHRAGSTDPKAVATEKYCSKTCLFNAQSAVIHKVSLFIILTCFKYICRSPHHHTHTCSLVSGSALRHLWFLVVSAVGFLFFKHCGGFLSLFWN